MTIFADTIDDKPMASSLGGVDRPIRPGSAIEGNTKVANAARRLPIDEEYLRDFTNRWEASTRYELEKARKRSEQSPDAMTARARLARIAYVCGETKEAVDAAVATLREAVTRCVDSVREVDVPATYVALQVMLRLGREDLAQEYLEHLVVFPRLACVQADVYLRADRVSEALDVLRSIDSDAVPGVATLKGYAFVKMERYANAVTELRSAIRKNAQDVEAALNLAVAFWHLGSSKKAVRWARYAARVCPGNYDAAIHLLYYLVKRGDYESAFREVQQLLDRRVVETPMFVVLQAAIAEGREQRSRARALLRRARTLAVEAGDEKQVAELDGQVIFSGWVKNELSRPEALDKIRSIVRRRPESQLLVAMLANLIGTVSGASELRAALNTISSSEDPTLLNEIEFRLAYLEGRFDDACDYASRWHDSDPLDERAAGISSGLCGALTEDWTSAARRVLLTMERLGYSEHLANQAAYSLALCGRIHEARSVLSRVSGFNYVLKATSGLVHLASGEVLEGLKLYNQAAEMADREGSTGHERCLMTLHQAMGLRRLNLSESESPMIRACALPSVELPGNWSDLPTFRFLAEVAQRRGWPWPTTSS